MSKPIKLNYDLSRNMITATLVTRDVCGCGQSHIKQEAPIGREYAIDLRSIRWVRFQCFGCGKTKELRVVDTWPGLADPLQLSEPSWFFLDALDLGEMIAGPPKPRSWEKVEGGKIAGPHQHLFQGGRRAN